MLARIAADLVVLLHLASIVFVVLGALLVVRWKWLALIHVPAVIWGARVEFAGAVCPLTPLEQCLRSVAGEQGYAGGFIGHYIVPLIYPAGLSASVELAMGAFVVAVNAAVYGLGLWRGFGRQSTRRRSS